MNPDIDKIITENIERIAEAEKIYRKAIEYQRKKIIKQENNRIIISIDDILKLDPVTCFLYEFLSPFGYNYSVVKEIILSLDKTPGKIFYSASYRLIKDRKNLLLEPLPSEGERKNDGKEILIHGESSQIRKPLHLIFRKIKKDKSFLINPSEEIANLDADKLSYPLILRKWKHGDFFYPFGRNQKKKISDFYIDLKFSRFDKESSWLLCSGDKIVWIVGYRIDNRFRVTQKTRKVLQIAWRK
jgi:tRNA(Ile)-lysidine synthase